MSLVNLFVLACLELADDCCDLGVVLGERCKRGWWFVCIFVFQQLV